MHSTSGYVGSMVPLHPHPPSPTLTNPDMILPDYDDSSSVALDDERSHSPLMMWKNSHAATSGSDLQHHLYKTQSNSSFAPSSMGPMTPTTPIIYGNGTMLSDIGEVTEVESTPGKPSPSRRRLSSPERGLKKKSSDSDSSGTTALRSSPTMGLDALKRKAKKKRRGSMDSDSTIKTEDHANLFADFSDAVSVGGDSVFQGDDEESVADTYMDEKPLRELHGNARFPTASERAKGGFGKARDDRQSAASLSRRAEEILANAKRRLTTMEDNLTRARSSLSMSSTSLSPDGTPSPPIMLRSASVLQEGHNSTTESFAPGHNRMGSENSLRIGLPVNVYPQRSASALGAAGGYRQPAIGSQSLEQIQEDLNGQFVTTSTYSHTTLSTTRELTLESLGEDDESPPLQQIEESLESPPSSAKLDSFLSPTFGSFSDKGLTRSASVAQMRDLKDQMKDLKGKVSALREQARADSLKRRSLQNLRTPSPFTHAQVDQWYAERRSSRIAGASGNDSQERNPWNGELESVVDENQVQELEASMRQKGVVTEDDMEGDIFNDYGVANGEKTIIPGQPEQENGRLFIPQAEGEYDPESLNCGAEPETPDYAEEEVMEMEQRLEEEAAAGEEYAEEEDDRGDEDAELPDDEAYESESGESMYHDAYQAPVSHEDREDAFDYEHFILHSALGTISQQRLEGRGRGSRGSFSSEDSVETTRGPLVSGPSKQDGGRTSSRSRTNKSRGRSRRNSQTSISSMDSFATATEGRSSRYFESAPEDNGAGEYAEEVAATPTPTPARPETPPTVRKTEISPRTSVVMTNGGNTTNSNDSQQEQQYHRHQSTQSQSSIPAYMHRAQSSMANSMHRPSVSSFESTGTNRSFPLVTRPKKTASMGVISDAELRNISNALMNETASAYKQAETDDMSGSTTANTDVDRSGSGSGGSGSGSSSSNVSPRHKHSTSVTNLLKGSIIPGNAAVPDSMKSLDREDQLRVERLVSGLGRCVLGLTESGRSSADSRIFRRRLDAARRILEGLEDP